MLVSSDAPLIIFSVRTVASYVDFSIYNRDVFFKIFCSVSRECLIYLYKVN